MLYLITAMKINILLKVLNPNDHAQLPDTPCPVIRHPCVQTEWLSIPTKKLHNRVKALKYKNYIH